jgi:hypothetical protein
MRPLIPLAALAFTLPAAALPLASASAAALRAEASAVIQNGISVRTAAAGSGPRVEARDASAMTSRQVVRPCRAGEVAPREQCRFLLVELH